MVAESENGTIYVYGDEATINADNVYLEYAEQTEYTNNEVLLQINDNLVYGFSLLSGLIGMLIGFLAVKELLRIWLH